jgi:hypothetical protein
MNEEFAVFANKVTKYLNDATIVARLSHWNVRGGPLFFSCHQLFERIYNDLGELMDALVELLRSCGFNPDFDLFKGPGISMEFYDCSTLIELVLDYLLALDGVIGMFYNFAEDHSKDPRLVGLGDHLQQMSSVVLNDIYLLQSSLP